MASITTRAVKGSALTHAEVDANFTNLNTDKQEKTFTQAGAGAVARTVEAKLKDVVSVKDFGAVGDGVADDRVAINAAIAAAAGKTLYFPAGTYLVNLLAATGLGTPPANTSFVGDGRSSSFLDIRAASTDYLNVFNASNENLCFEDLKIKLTLLGGGTAALFIFVANSSGFKLKNCDLSSSSSVVNLTHYSFMISCGTSVSTGKKDLLIEGCRIHNWHSPLLKTNASLTTEQRWKIVGNYFYDNDGTHWSPNSPAGVHDDILIQGNSFGTLYGNLVGGNHFVGLASVTNCRITDNTFVGVTAGEAIHIEEGSYDLVVADNTISVGERTNQVTWGDAIRLMPNNVGGTTKYPSRVTITGNAITRTGSTGGVGIGITWDATPEPASAWATVSNNVIDGFGIGIEIDPDVGGLVRVSDNILKGCTNGIYAPQGALTSTSGNTFVSCTNGLVGKGLAGPALFTSTTTPINSTNDGNIGITGWSVAVKSITLAVGPSNTGVVLMPIGLRIDGNLRWSFNIAGGAALTGAGSINLAYDGTTLTQTPLNVWAPGVVGPASPALSVSGGNLVFTIFNGSIQRTGVTLCAEFSGMHIHT